jgi:putative membrane protein
MFRRRTMISLLALASITSSCRIFTPINPNPPARPAPKQADKPKPVTAPANEPASQPVAQPASRPATQPAVKAAQQAAPRPIGNVNDANIAAMVLASNNTDISYARLVPSRAERTDIKEFAQRMLTDHVGVNGLVTDLLSKLDLAPEDNSASLDMRDESAAKRDMMRELSGYAFDSTYIENEIVYHRRFLSFIDGVMIPRARNRDLHALLTSVRPAVAAHLSHAEQVRANVISKK